MASEYLQKEEMDIVTAVDAIQALIKQLQSFRNNTTFDKFVQDAKAIARKCGVQDDFSTEGSKRHRT